MPLRTTGVAPASRSPRTVRRSISASTQRNARGSGHLRWRITLILAACSGALVQAWSCLCSAPTSPGSRAGYGRQYQAPCPGHAAPGAPFSKQLEVKLQPVAAGTGYGDGVSDGDTIVVACVIQDLDCQDQGFGQAVSQARLARARPSRACRRSDPLSARQRVQGPSCVSKHCATCSTRSSRGRTVTKPSSWRRQRLCDHGHWRLTEQHRCISGPARRTGLDVQ